MRARKYRFGPKAATSGYTQLPNVVLYDAELTAAARLLYAMLWDLATFAQDEPEQDELAHKMGCAPKTLRGYIAELVAAGLVKSIRRGRGMTNAYEVNVPLNGRNYRSRTVEITVPLPIEDEVQDDVEANASTSRGEEQSKPPRARNLVFDAVAEECGADPRNRRRAAEIAAAVKEIRSYVAADHPDVAGEELGQLAAAEVVRRARLYRQRMSGATLTPSALAKWWHDVDREQKRHVLEGIDRL